MDHKKLVEVVKQMPHLWDRNCSTFRDKEAKDRAWEEVGRRIDRPAYTCKETFKSLREKYLRERAKSHHPDPYQHWDLLDDLKFLEPHIVPRSARSSNCPYDDDMSLSSDSDPTDFDRLLIDMVRKATPIWDRNSNTYPNRTSKFQLWDQIGSALNRDINSCQLRWKALREKYIRQKAKFMEGDAKWELLDDMEFLDKVIQYRKKQNDLPGHCNSSRPTRGSYQDSSYIKCSTDGEDYSYTDSSNDFLSIVKEESAVQQVADSSFGCKRPRQTSVSSYGGEQSSEKQGRFEEGESSKARTETSSEKTPEQLFGNLVASLLSKKPENQRNLYMIEIMTLLSK
ncbi:uncharacterized protein [Euwallacea similis]|uniref:uncharacterized protein n=1 Tax=Euwallacea similis TaxID=1736056 RepID=UPI00344F3685